MLGFICFVVSTCAIVFFVGFVVVVFFKLYKTDLPGFGFGRILLVFSLMDCPHSC